MTLRLVSLWRNASLHAKLMLAMVSLTALVAGMLAFLVVEQDRERRFAELEGRATRIADLFGRSLAMPLWNVDLPAVEEQLAALAPNPEVAEFTVTAVNYGVVAEVKRPEQPGPADAVVRIRTIEHAPFPGAQPQNIGEVRVVLTRAVAKRAIAEGRRAILGTAVVALGLLYVVTYALIHRLVRRPIGRLEEMVDRIARGDLDARCPVESRDELGLLAQRVNAMADHLSEAAARLLRHQEELEQAVRERTAQLNDAKERAEVASRAKSAFLASMSHELRTPLNGILGYAQILRRDRSLGPQQLARLNVMHQSGEHLLALINDILDFARIEAGKVELHPSNIALPAFLGSVADAVRVSAAAKGLELRCELAPELPAWVRADERRLRQVLFNLLSNAVRFTERGRVSLRAGVTPEGRLRFEVEDTGVGIDEGHRQAIFQPFEQAGTLRHRVGGTGLGLPISRQYVRLMGGDIEVESRVGQGSLFRFELALPAVEARPDAVPSDLGVSGYRGPRRTVLVVDDVAENRAVVTDLLGPLGFEVAEAADGDEGLARAQALRPDLILMDVVMPGMDGLEAVRCLRQSPELRETPVIALSASVSGRDEERSLAAGMNAFLPKPVNFDRLLEEMGELMHLEWIREPSVAPPSGYGAAQPLAVPPAAELQALHRLALIGNMRDIARRAAQLVDLDERFRPFAETLGTLAESYQSRAILELVEAQLGALSASGPDGTPPAPGR